MADTTQRTREGECLAVPGESITSADRLVEAFRFRPVSLFVDEDAVVRYEDSPRSHSALRYEIVRGDEYSRIMTSVTRFLIGSVLD